MSDKGIHECECADCRSPGWHINKELHRQINLFVSRLNEQHRRWYVALESTRIGHGGDTQMSLITGMDVDTIRTGRRELADSLSDCPRDRVRRPGGGRPRVEKKIRKSRPT
jgi:hypothetical protein